MSSKVYGGNGSRVSAVDATFLVACGYPHRPCPEAPGDVEYVSPATSVTATVSPGAMSPTNAGVCHVVTVTEYWSRNTLLRILPVGLRGMASAKITFFGIL